MMIFIDENLPKRLKGDFSDYEIYTVRDMGWNGKTNGELLRLMIADDFNLLLTFDKNIAHQQNFQKYTIPLIGIHASGNDYESLKPFLPKIKQLIEEDALVPGVLELKEESK